MSDNCFQCHGPDHTSREGDLRLDTEQGLLGDDPADAVVVPQGGFFQTTGGNWVYVLENGEAVKRQIELGRQNPQYFEVLSGLEIGEQVVTCSYDTFGDADRLILQ